MTGRALVFSHPEIVRLAGAAFIPYAGDQWYLHRQKDADGEFFWRVAQQGHNRALPEDVTRQGIYVAAADGRLLASDHFRPSPERMLALLREAGRKWEEASSRRAPVPEATRPDGRYARVPPAGGLILKVYSRIPLERAPDERWSPNHATGRDHMWLTRAEWRGLLPAEWKNGLEWRIPPPVAERLTRFHLVDNVRGEPPMWTPREIMESRLTLAVEDAAAGRIRLTGTARMEAGQPEARGYQARLQGVLEYDRAGDRLRRAEVLAWGEAWGEGRYTRGAPPGRFPLLIAFTLAGTSPADRVPPQGSRSLDDYLGTRKQ